MNRFRSLAILLALSVSVFGGNVVFGQDYDYEDYEYPPWYVGFGLGQVRFEGDEAVEDGMFLSLKLGYDYSPRWTFEGALNYAPKLDGNTVYDYESGVPVERVGLIGADNCSMYGLSFDILFHWFGVEDRHWDPYLIAGAGFRYFDEERNHREKTDITLRGGMGLAYHFNPEWALRGDFVSTITTEHTEFNMMPCVALTWKWGAHVPGSYRATGGLLDTDGDGLPDDREAELRTDPLDPDTDDDGLTDGEEVNTYTTDPLNPDTDYDGLMDGPEVFDHTTDPKDRDTDDGGVADGHEVIEDNTNPLNPADDLMLVTLNIEFGTDKAVIRPEYQPDLDVLATTLKRDPGATARIEGHADKRKTSAADYNLKLSERRANSVLDYLVSKGIARNRLTAVGYGFTRPLAPNDPVKGNQKNRRVEVYIRETGK